MSTPAKRKFFMMLGSTGASESFSVIKRNLDYVGFAIPNNTWAQARSATSGTGSSTSAGSFEVGFITTNYYSIRRAFFAIPKPAQTVTGCDITIERENLQPVIDDSYLYLCTNGGTLSFDDYDSFSTQLSNRTAADANSITYTLNAAGIAALNSASGQLNLVIRNYRDVENNPPTTYTEADILDFNVSTVTFYY